MQELINKTSPEGGVVLGDYQLLEEIGRGGYGLVYKARHLRTGQAVAVKTIRLDEEDKDKFKVRIARFEREADLCARVNHPNIVKLLDRGYSKNRKPYAVFELLEGETLKDYIASEQGLTAEQTREVMIQVLDALDFAHAQGIIHRDLKPQNIMVSQMASRLHIKILDFGIGSFSKEFRSVDYRSLTLTQEMMGTPNYSAPEQLRGESATQRTDLYAWGLILVECLTGKPLVNGRSVAEVFQQQLMPTEVVLPSFVLSHPLAALLRRVLKKNPQNRAFDARSVLDELLKINFNSLQVPAYEASVEDDLTAVNQVSTHTAHAARKQITVLGIRLDLLSRAGNTHELEILDAIEKDQLNLCKDIAMRYGGHIGGVVANHMVVYFGYPETDDTDTRRAARTALELRKQISKRSENLVLMHGLSTDLRVTLHTGKTLVFSNQSPEGNVPNTAFKLLYQTPAGTILVTDYTRKLLEPYVDFSSPKSVQLNENAPAINAYELVNERDASTVPLLRSQSLAREMMGRSVELQSLQNQWAKTVEAGQAMIIEGQAGIGKSRLVHEFMADIKKNEGRVIQCRCLPEQQNNALYPFLGFLRGQWKLEETEEVSLKIEKVKRFLSEANCTEATDLALMCSWLSLPFDHVEILSEIPPEEQKKRLFKIINACIGLVTNRAAFVLVVEDIHWIDPTSKEFVDSLLEEIKTQQGLLLMTTRPVKSPPFEGLVVEYLNPIAPEACAGIVESILPGEEIDPEAIQYILDRTDGIPLYAEEMTSMLVEQNYLVRHKERYELIADLDEQSIPNTLQDLLNARLDRLGPARETAQMAAAIGREFDYQLLVQITDKNEESIGEDLALLQQADIIGEPAAGEKKYLFRHALISDAAYDGMTRSFRRGVHLRIAEALEESFAEVVNESPSLLANHLFEGASYEKAVRFGLKASNLSVERSASSEAIVNSEKVLKWVDKLEKKAAISARLELYAVLTSAHMQKSGWAAEEVGEYTEKGIELLRDSERYDDLIPHLWWKVLGGVVGGENDNLIPISEEMASYLEHLNPLSKSAVRCAQAFLITALGRQNVWRQSISYCEEAIQFYHEAGEELTNGHENIFGFSVPVFAGALLAMGTNTLGDFETAKKHSEQMMADARACKSAASLGIALMYAAEIDISNNDREKTIEFTEELVALSKEFNLPVYEAYGQMQLDWAKGVLDHEASTRQVLLDDNSMFSLAHYQSHYAEAYAAQGQLEEALAKVEDSIAIDERIKHHYYLARMYFFKGKYLCQLGRKEEGNEAIEKAMTIAQLQGSGLYISEIEEFKRHME